MGELCRHANMQHSGSWSLHNDLTDMISLGAHFQRYHVWGYKKCKSTVMYFFRGGSYSGITYIAGTTAMVDDNNEHIHAHSTVLNNRHGRP